MRSRLFHDLGITGYALSVQTSSRRDQTQSLLASYVRLLDYVNGASLTNPPCQPTLPYEEVPPSSVCVFHHYLRPNILLGRHAL
jgi:hypothetical protein